MTDHPPTGRPVCKYCGNDGVHANPACPGLELDAILYGDFWAYSPRVPDTPLCAHLTAVDGLDAASPRANAVDEMRVSAELLADVEPMRAFYKQAHTEMIDAFIALCAREELKARMRAEGLDPMEHRPGRTEWRDATRPERIRRNIRNNLGMKPGQTARLITYRTTQGATTA